MNSENIEEMLNSSFDLSSIDDDTDDDPNRGENLETMSTSMLYVNTMTKCIFWLYLILKRFKFYIRYISWKY